MPGILQLEFVPDLTRIQGSFLLLTSFKISSEPQG